jgi:hypothetical protein
MRALKNRVYELNNEHARLSNYVRQPNHLTNGTEDAVARERTAIVRACPSNTCRGFLNSQWRCGICEQLTCHNCHVIIGVDADAPHQCNADDVATAQMINRGTKPCPKCSVPIYKIEGCNQMFCTVCYTAFEWTSGRILNLNHVHNPHYFEWLRNRGGNPENGNNVLQNINPCQREITTGFVNNMQVYVDRILKRQQRSMPLRRYYNNANDYQRAMNRHIPEPSTNLNLTPFEEWLTNNETKIFDICRHINHMRRVDMPKFNANILMYNRDLRVKYLLKEIDENKLKQLLQQSDKRQQKNQEITNILDMVTTTAGEIMWRLYDLFSSRTAENNNQTNILEQCEAILNEIDVLCDYANGCLSDISNTYGSVEYFIQGMILGSTKK